MSKKLKTTVKLIQAITDMNMDEIARSIDYTRSYLNRFMNSDEENKDIENALLQKYKPVLEEFFDESLNYVEEDSAEYRMNARIVDVENELVNNSIVIKGMMRVLLRNQAFIISLQTGEDLTVVLDRITVALKDELKEDFSDEL